MSRHPQLLPPIVKEVHYFDQNFDKGSGWYNAHFPTLGQAKAIEDRIGAPTFAFDTTPYYLFHPQATERVHSYQPKAKLIALLRDPVLRSWSHYRYEKMRGFEPLDAEAALAAESVRVPNAHHVYGTSREAHFMHQHYTYSARSEYDVQIERWLTLFPREQMLILRAEDLFSNPRGTLQTVWRFLGVSQFELDDYGSLNQGEFKKLPEGVESWLQRRLAPSIARCPTIFSYDEVG
jgi:Sulfotransferase domain